MWPFSINRRLKKQIVDLEASNQYLLRTVEGYCVDLEAARAQLAHQRNLMDEAALSSRRLIEISQIESGLIDALSNLVMTCRTHFDFIQNECTPKSRAETRRMRNLARHMIERIDAEMSPPAEETNCNAA